MPTLNIVTTALATANRTRINLYKESAPLAIVDTLTHDAPHGEETWTFFGLEAGENYRYRWIEIDGGGATLQQYATQWFTVPATGTVEVKPTAYLVMDLDLAEVVNEEGVKVGKITDANTLVFDGTDDTEDYRGWDITVDKPGFGDQFPGSNYTWNKTTGTYVSGNPLEAEEKLTFQFDPKIAAVVPVESRNLYEGVLIVTGTVALTTNDIKKKIIIEGAEPYLEITLPTTNTIPENKIIYIESGIGNHKCARIISATGNDIQWMQAGRSDLFICPSESIQLYIEGSNIRVHLAEGNFKTVGEIISEFTPVASVINKVELNATEYDIYEQARLYEYVLSLTANERVSYVNWSTGNNKYKYSLANGSGKFHVPDIRDLFERVTDGTRNSGDYLADMVGPHTHPGKQTTTNIAGTQYEGNTLKSGNDRGLWTGNNITIAINDGTETRPKSYTTRRFVKV